MPTLTPLEKALAMIADPLELFRECHRRIIEQLDLLAGIVQTTGGGPLTGRSHEAMAAALHYFRQAVPTHTADEEEFLFPLLVRDDSPPYLAAAARIDALVEDHQCAELCHTELDLLGRQCLTAARISSPSARQMAVLLERMLRLYRYHIGIEESEILPLAANLSLADREILRAAMSHR